MGMRQQLGSLYSAQQQQRQAVLMSPLNNASLLRQALTQKIAEQQQQQQAAVQQQQQQQQVLQQQQTLSGGCIIYPSDIDFITDFTDLNCDVDQIISQELSYGGTLDFSDDPTSTAAST